MSVIKHKDQRVGIFIDTQNLYHSAKNLYKSRVNFGNVVKDALAGRVLIRSIAYVITTEAGDETNFFEALEKLGIEAKTKKQYDTIVEPMDEELPGVISMIQETQTQP